MTETFITGARTVIVSGGAAGSWILDKLRPDDYIIGADAGALFLIRSGITPHLSLGDFDSIGSDEKAEVQRLSMESAAFDPVDKNYTDTELALMRAIERRPDSILMLAVTGSRLDHTLANVHLLRMACDNGIEAVIEDEWNRIRLLAPGTGLRVVKSRYQHVSLLPLSLEVSGIHLFGFQYPLSDATLRIGQSLGISNVLSGESGTVHSAEGWLLVMESIG